MYQQCPKCGFKNSADQSEEVCPQCGLIFDKWLKNKYKTNDTSAREQESKYVSTLIQTLLSMFYFLSGVGLLYFRIITPLNLIIHLCILLTLFFTKQGM